MLKDGQVVYAKPEKYPGDFPVAEEVRGPSGGWRLTCALDRWRATSPPVDPVTSPNRQNANLVTSLL